MPDSNLIWICKSHYPTTGSMETPFNCEKAIVVVRNPIDVVPSAGNLFHTFSHSLTPNERYDKDFPEWWEAFVNWITKRMAHFHKGLTTEISEKIPTYITRYEDLKLNPEPILKEMFCFLLDVPSIEGTIVEKRIEQ